MLNFSRDPLTEFPFALEEDAYITFYIDMSKEIKIEARVVNSLFDLFGSIGGLKEVFASFILLVIGGFQTKRFLIEQTEAQFRTYDNDEFMNFENSNVRQFKMKVANYS